MKSADVIAILKQHGWEHIRTRGSHHQFRHPVHPGLVTVPHPKKILSPVRWRKLGVRLV
nr:YcfA-like protein [Escherichia coli 9.0111]